MGIIAGIIRESYLLLNEMSAYLLFGFLMAGVLHVFISRELIAGQLGKNQFSSVLKASLFGIPLPLCSCGVLPAAMSLRKEGASKGAVLSFLISTPTTGVDSLLATYALLGGVFTVFRVVACFVIALLAGILANIFIKDDNKKANDQPFCKFCDEKQHVHKHRLKEKIKVALKYGFGELLDDTGAWIIAGVFVGGAISCFVPDNFFEQYLSNVWLSMLIMFCVGVPMYVCSSGSIPIAAALMLKGLNPGAALVILLTGPATNSISLLVIGKELGKNFVGMMLGSIVAGALGAGLLLNIIFGDIGLSGKDVAFSQHEIFSNEIKIACSVILLGLIFFNFLQGKRKHS